MKSHYRVKLTPNPVIVRVYEDTEEIIYDKRHLKISVAENLVSDLNKGFTVNWDELN